MPLDAMHGPLDDEGTAADARAVRDLVTRLAVVAVQGEHLQALCDELEPVLHHIRRDPKLLAPAQLLAATLETVAGVAQDIALVTDALGSGLQPARTGRRPPPEGDAP